MKALKLLLIGLVFAVGGNLQAQVAVDVKVGTPPPWGPAGYESAKYYYLPDVDSFYDVPSATFIYYSGGVWVRRAYLPSRYRNYDLYEGYKVVITDYEGKNPHSYYKELKTKYAKGYRGPSQKTIGERPGGGNQKPNIGNKGNPSKKMNPGGNKSPGHFRGIPPPPNPFAIHHAKGGGKASKGGGKGGKK